MAVCVPDGLGQKIGHIEDPWKCCVMDQRIFGPDGQQIYGAAGSVCQTGVFCPCLAPVEFALTDTNGQPTDGGIAKIFGVSRAIIAGIWVAFFQECQQSSCGQGCAEIVAKVNKFRVTFPAGADPKQKMALIGCTMLIDFEYFEKKS